MIYKRSYRCSCGATKEVKWDSERVGKVPSASDMPLSVVCGYQGCQERACNVCRGSRKVYQGLVALDTVPGYDPRVRCPHCVVSGG